MLLDHPLTLIKYELGYATSRFLLLTPKNRSPWLRKDATAI